MSDKHIPPQQFLTIFEKAVSEGLLRQNPDGNYVYRRSSDVIFDRLSAIMKQNGATDADIESYKQLFKDGNLRDVKELWKRLYGESTEFPTIRDPRVAAIRARFGSAVSSGPSSPSSPGPKDMYGSGVGINGNLNPEQ